MWLNFSTRRFVLWDILSIICLNFDSFSLFSEVSSFLCPRKWEHIAGERVNAQIAEIAIDTAIQTANCLYIIPVMPPINIIGTNTAIKTSAIATRAEPTSCIVS